MIRRIRDKIASVIEKRLDELTPQLVKEIVQAMIKKHLGWLVGLGWFFWWSDWSDRGILQSAGRLVTSEASVSNVGMGGECKL